MQPKAGKTSSSHLLFVRHGATEANLAGVRCGGDLDVPLTDFGRRQAAEAGLKIRELRIPVGFIVTSGLQRTRESAAIISRLLGGVDVVIEPDFAERHLGEWNLRSVAATQAELVQGVTPPGGESNAQFLARIQVAMESLLPRLGEQPLLVGSKGVARAMSELLGVSPIQDVSNGQMAHFNLALFAARSRQGCAA
jgi:2,3-bisphosphoglycerate-dependent phosphoglycerate mutase